MTIKPKWSYPWANSRSNPDSEEGRAGRFRCQFRSPSRHLHSVYCNLTPDSSKLVPLYDLWDGRQGYREFSAAPLWQILQQCDESLGRRKKLSAGCSALNGLQPNQEFRKTRKPFQEKHKNYLTPFKCVVFSWCIRTHVAYVVTILGQNAIYWCSSIPHPWMASGCYPTKVTTQVVEGTGFTIHRNRSSIKFVVELNERPTICVCSPKNY